MKPNSRKERRHAILRVFGTDRLNRAIDERIRTGRDLEGLTKAKREYCALVLHASSHAGQMTADERREYRKALAAYRAMLARRKRLR
jgi:hypothetical protein